MAQTPLRLSGNPLKPLADLCKQASWGDAFDHVVGLQTLLFKEAWPSCVTNYPRLVCDACADAVRQGDGQANRALAHGVGT